MSRSGLHGGTLPAGSHALSGFADEVNAYLDQAKADGGETFLRFLVTSDTPGNVSIDIGRLEYTLLQTETWPNPLDGSLRIDRNLELEFGARSRIELAALRDPPSQRMGLDRVMLDVSGELGPERRAGGRPRRRRRARLTVSGDYAVGQRLRLTSEEELVKPRSRRDSASSRGTSSSSRASRARFGAGGDAELYVELQGNADGRPETGTPLASQTLTLVPTGNGEAGWAFAGFDEPAEIEIDGTTGSSSEASAAPRGSLFGLGRRLPRTEVCVNRGGQLWKRVPPMPPADVRRAGDADARLVYLPEPDNESAAVELGLEETSSRCPPTRARLCSG